jgi:molecular chaperone IbpA
MNARTFDLTPFHRATVGFDKLFDLVDRQFANSPNQGYPPYNIVKHDENTYGIELAVAGFKLEDLTITQDKNELVIEGIPAVFDEETQRAGEYLHKGIATRSFKRVFTLANYVEVKGAQLELGVLSVILERNVPEALLPKKIAIGYKS